MSYIEIYDKVRANWENESGTQTSPASPTSPVSFGGFKLSNGVLSATIGAETKTVDFNSLIPQPKPDLHLKSVAPSADGEKLIFKIGEAENSTHDKTVEINFKEQIVKLLGTSATPYDDTEIKKRLSALEAAGLSGGNPFKEYEAQYISKEAIGNFGNNAFVSVSFTKKFSKTPFVSATLDLKTTQPRVAYLANITEEGFQFSASYSADVKGIWYQAYVVE